MIWCKKYWQNNKENNDYDREHKSSNVVFKENFKSTFINRIAETYGRSVEESHRFEQYMVLGTLVRDYASIRWKKTKEQVQDNKQREMVYLKHMHWLLILYT